MKKFKVRADYVPAGDQPEAIEKLSANLKAGHKHQVLLGVTGSGKTYTLAKTIERVQKPTLVICHNKTLAGQLYQEFRDFFPKNAVSYFVSYYDYYQPEAYTPQTDTYIEKETSINDEIDKLRLATTTNLLTRPDVIVVASVSCIYNLGSPKEYALNMLELIEGELIDREDVITRLVDLRYQRGQILNRGSFRVRGGAIEIWPANEEVVVRLSFEGKKLAQILWLDPVEFSPLPDRKEGKRALIPPAKHFLTNPVTQPQALEAIRRDLQIRLKQLEKQGKNFEAHRLEQRVNYDLEMIETLGYVNGIENYSRYFDGRQPGEVPFTLLDYLEENSRMFNTDGFLVVLDESHMSVAQIRGMYRGDRSRKEILIDYGFRLPSALDNRPLKFEEFAARAPQTVYVSATPEEYEISLALESGGVTEQLVRPTGLLEPKVEVRPIEGQVRDLVKEILERKERGERVLVTTLTKRMAEDLAGYLKEKEASIKVHYLHADVKTLDRSDILDDLRLGEVDVVVGINLLREGLDLPEVSLVAILDADKEGFLRSKTSLIQTMGRAARHIQGKVILYADVITGSMTGAMAEIERRRQIQLGYNQRHSITPRSVVKPVRDKLLNREKGAGGVKTVADLEVDPQALTPDDKQKLAKKLKALMNQAAKNWEFEKAAAYRDTIAKL